MNGALPGSSQIHFCIFHAKKRETKEKRMLPRKRAREEEAQGTPDNRSEASHAAARQHFATVRKGSCVICLNPNPTVALLCCGTAVHMACMTRWLRTHAQSSTCVMCRQQVREPWASLQEEYPPPPPPLQTVSPRLLSALMASNVQVPVRQISTLGSDDSTTTSDSDTSDSDTSSEEETESDDPSSTDDTDSEEEEDNQYILIESEENEHDVNSDDEEDSDSF